jgi:hypothetical protein
MKCAVALLTCSFCAASGVPSHGQQLAKPVLQPIIVPTAPPAHGQPQLFRDSHFGVRFDVPPGWTVTRKDGEVSTFHSDARSAPPEAEMRGVASLGFNPYPDSVLSGASVYYSVERHATRAECTGQVATDVDRKPDMQHIGGVAFRHGHDEHGAICTEARDEIYTAYRKRACYRFDLAMNTFCSISSGAQDLTERQLFAVEQRMTDILSTVALDWNKTGPELVPVPATVDAAPQTAPHGSAGMARSLAPVSFQRVSPGDRR